MKSNAWQKLLVSIINISGVFILSLPLLFVFGISYGYRIALVLLFLLYQLVIIFFPDKRSIGAILTHTRWSKSYPIKNHIIYALLYSMSFSTAMIWIAFPFDLLLINLLLVQWPFVHFTGYTLHGYASGKMVGTIKS